MRERLFLIGLPFLLATNSFCMASSDVSRSDLLARIGPAVVSIIHYDERGDVRGRQSGFFIRHNLIVSTRSSLKQADHLEAQLIDGTIAAIKGILAEDKEADLLLLALDGQIDAPAQIELVQRLPNEDDALFLVCRGTNDQNHLLEATVSAILEIQNFGIIVQINTSSDSPIAGCPIADRAGKVIAVATSHRVQEKRFQFAIPAERVLDLEKGDLQLFAVWSSPPIDERLATADEVYLSGLPYLWIEEYEQALTYFSEAARKNPNHQRAWFYLGRAAGSISMWEEAINALHQALRLDPNDSVAYHDIGVAYGNMAEWQEAVYSLQKSIQIRPNDAAVHLDLAWVYNKLNRYEEAVQVLKEAVRIQPDLPIAHYNLGVAYGYLGRWEAAVGAFQQATAIKPDYGMALYNLGVSFNLLGKKDAALEQHRLLQGIDQDLAAQLLAIIQN